MGVWENETSLGLAKRAVSLPNWPWLPGMAFTRFGDVVERITEVHSQDEWEVAGYGRYWRDGGELPVLDDPATIGCLICHLNGVDLGAFLGMDWTPEEMGRGLVDALAHVVEPHTLRTLWRVT